MACSKRGSVVRLSAKPRAPVVGEAELVLIKYRGWVDEIFYIGSATGAEYAFGLDKQRAYVDSRDLDGFLTAKEDDRIAFELVT